MVGGRCVTWMEAGGVEGDRIEARGGQAVESCGEGWIVVPSVGVGARRRGTTPFLSATFLSVVIRRGGRRVAAIK